MVAVAMGYLLAFNSTDRIPDPTGRRTSHALVGVNRPGCGGTRMLWYPLRGDITQVARHHLVALICVPFAGDVLLVRTVRAWFGRRLPPLRLWRWVCLGYGMAWLLYAVVLRNLPGRRSRGSTSRNLT